MALKGVMRERTTMAALRVIPVMRVGEVMM